MKKLSQITSLKPLDEESESINETNFKSWSDEKLVQWLNKNWTDDHVGYVFGTQLKIAAAEARSRKLKLSLGKQKNEDTSIMSDRTPLVLTQLSKIIEQADDVYNTLAQLEESNEDTQELVDNLSEHINSLYEKVDVDFGIIPVQIDEALAWQLMNKNLAKLGFKEIKNPSPSEFHFSQGKIQHIFGIPMRAGKWADTFFVILDTEKRPYGIVDASGTIWYETLGDALKKINQHAESGDLQLYKEEDLNEITSPQQRTDMDRVNAGAMKRDDYDKKWKKGKYRPKGNPLAGPGGLYKNLLVKRTNEESELDEGRRDDAFEAEMEGREEEYKMKIAKLQKLNKEFAELRKKRDSGHIEDAAYKIEIAKLEKKEKQIEESVILESYDDYVVRYRVGSGKDGMGPIATKEKSFKTLKQMAKWMETAEEKVPHFYEIVATAYPTEKNEETVDESVKNMKPGEFKPDKKQTAAIKEFEKVLKQYKQKSLKDPEDDMRDMYADDFKRLTKVYDLYVAGKWKSAETSAYELDTSARESIPSKVWSDINALDESVISEVLDPNDEAGVWIDDFVKSTDKRFDGKSKKERIKMALGAWYAAQKKESVNTNETVEEIEIDEDAAEKAKIANKLIALKSTLASIQAKKKMSDYNIKYDAIAKAQHAKRLMDIPKEIAALQSKDTSGASK